MLLQNKHPERRSSGADELNLILSGLPVYRRDRSQIDHGLARAAALEDVHGFGHSEQYWADDVSPPQTVEQLIS
jgi:hypothetical protein